MQLCLKNYQYTPLKYLRYVLIKKKTKILFTLNYFNILYNIILYICTYSKQIVYLFIIRVYVDSPGFAQVRKKYNYEIKLK